MGIEFREGSLVINSKNQYRLKKGDGDDPYYSYIPIGVCRLYRGHNTRLGAACSDWTEGGEQEETRRRCVQITLEPG